MQSKQKELLVAIMLVLIYPALIASFVIRYDTPNTINETQQKAGPVETSPEEPEKIKVVTDSGTVSEMLLNDYLTCVLLAEMPLSFHEEALKAQAVVARTYALRRQQSGSKHADAPVCTDANCCQGFKAKEEFGGSKEEIEKAQNAVQNTAGKVLAYNDQLIDATYFSSSGGMTEAAVAVWGADIPYLQAQPSPGEENAKHYVDTVTFTTDEFARMLQVKKPDDTGWIGDISYTAGGGVDTIAICGTHFKGTQVRQLLGLRSTAFAINVVGESVVITTKGFGHRVGMSQYGADAMARQGKTYEQILLHYYQGAQIKTNNED